jgi:adenylylsulfate kinase
VAKALLVTGVVGVGKTSVTGAVGEVFRGAGVAHGVIDVDWLAFCWPAPADDPYNTRLREGNLRAVAESFLAAGARRLVVAGVVESLQERARYEEALGCEVAVCRLRASVETVRGRLVGRFGERDAEGLRWHVRRIGELERVFDAAGVEDFAVEAEAGLDVVAAEVLARWDEWSGAR